MKTTSTEAMNISLLGKDEGDPLFLFFGSSCIKKYFVSCPCSRYFAVGLVNAAGKTIKASLKMGLTVVYQIHREGISAPLQHVPLKECWTDNLYYFSTIKFKKSGRYTISFIVERANATASSGTIKPLIFPVVVQAERIRCGIADALDKLVAFKYVDQSYSSGRAVLTGRLELLAVINQLRSAEMSEFDAVKCALLMLYAALPAGALSAPATASKGSINSSINGDSLINQIAEPKDWTDALDQAWRGAVFESKCAKSLMELTLLLEFYINKQWIGSPQSKLLQALPSPHFAVRCATLSAVSLRIFCIDKALLYDKLQLAPRERRSSSGGKPNETKGGTVGTTGGRRSSSGRQAVEEDDVGAENHWQNRQKRSAAAAASAKIRNLNGNEDSGDDEQVVVRADDETPRHERRKQRRGGRYRSGSDDSSSEADDGEDEDGDDNDDDDDDDEGGRTAQGGSRRIAARMAAVTAEQRQSLTHWTCPTCSTHNELRARSCEACGERKPAAADITTAASSRSTRNASRSAVPSRSAVVSQPRRAHRVIAASDEDDEEPGDDGEESNNRELRKRKSSSASYFEDNSDDDDDEDRNRKRRKKAAAAALASPDINQYERQMQEYRRSLPLKLQQLSDFIRSLAFAAEGGDAAADSKMRMLSLLRWLLSDIRTEPFWTPVDLKVYSTYTTIVQVPMDLGTILSRTKEGLYTDVYAFLRVLEKISNFNRY